MADQGEGIIASYLVVLLSCLSNLFLAQYLIKVGCGCGWGGGGSVE